MEKKYPRAMRFMSRNHQTFGNDHGVTVWLSRDAGAGEIFHLSWENGSPHVIVSKMTNKGDPWFNNWDNSQGSTPPTWEECDRFPVSGAPDVRAKMDSSVRDRYAVSVIL